MVISFGQEVNGRVISSSRTQPLNSYEAIKVGQDALEVLKKFCRKSDGTYHIVFLGISVGNFQENKETTSIKTFFKNMEKKKVVNSDLTNILPLTIPNLSVYEDQINEQESISSADDESNNKSSNSVYSASTEELNEDYENLIYFEDIFPEKISSQSILDYVRNDNQDSEVSPSPEVSELRQSSSQSFFIKYFQTCQADESSSSRSSKENDMECLSETVVNPPSVVSCLDAKDLEDDCFEMCLECNKKIAVSEMISHKDYHLALEILKEEKSIEQKPTKRILISKSDKTSTKKIKTEKNSVLSFLKDKIDLNDSNSGICPLCNRRIKFEDLGTHADYHTAKALLSQDMINKEAIDNDIKKQLVGANSIKSFFTKCDKLNETNSIFCPKCNKHIKLEDSDSHSDYHMAKELTKELNCVVPQRTPARKESSKNKVKKNNVTISSLFKTK